MDDAVKKILSKRRDRMIATILGAKEDICDPYVTRSDANEFRKIILDQVNDYYDLVMDLLRSVQPEGLIINEEYVRKLDEIHEALVGVHGDT